MAKPMPTEPPVGEKIADIQRTGADTLLGNGGDDLLIGGAGRDRLTGGSDGDIFRISAIGDSYRGSADIIHDFDPTADRIDLGALLGHAAVERRGEVFDLDLVELREAVLQRAGGEERIVGDCGHARARWGGGGFASRRGGAGGEGGGECQGNGAGKQAVAGAMRHRSTSADMKPSG